MLSTGEYVFALIVATVGACRFMNWLTKSRTSQVVSMAASSLIPGCMAYLSLREYLAADPAINSQIPWWYMRFWVALWVSLTIVTLIPGLSGKVWLKIARFFKYLFKIWGPENAPARVWLAVCFFAFGNLILIRTSSWGHEFEPGLPQYPRHLWWLWYWLTLLSPLAFTVAVLLVYRDDFQDLWRKLRAEKEELVKKGKTEGDKEKGKELTVAVPATGARMHLILNLVSDIFTELLFGHKRTR